jgi:hypothetical protein
MACGRQPSKRRPAGRDFPDIGWGSRDVSLAAFAGGQLCGQVGRSPSTALRVQLAGFIAQKNGTENPLNINDLQHSIGAARVTTVRNASIGAAVELSPRASRRSADG